MSDPSYLFQQLRLRMETSILPPESSFLPLGTLSELVTKGEIEAEMRKYPNYSDELVEFIEDHAKKVFAILVFDKIPFYAPKLLNYKFQNKHLPVFFKKPPPKGDKTAERVSGFFSILESGEALDRVPGPLDSPKGDKTPEWIPRSFNILEDDEALNWFKSFNPDDLLKFQDSQWRFLAPKFTESSIMELLPDKSPLPIVAAPEVTMKDANPGGSFSIIHTGNILKEHVEGLNGDQNVAIKVLNNSLTEKAYEIEADALGLTKGLAHTHLVKFFAGFQQRQKDCLIFEWVDGGDLNTFWNHNEPEKSVDYFRWALTQFHGLAGALKELHGRNCRHTDLKPNNILRQLGPHGSHGTFKIADLGLAKVHVLPTGNRNANTTNIPGASRYQPPEEIHICENRTRSRSYDLWSMGCLLFELIVWLLYGTEGRTEFNESFTGPFFSQERDLLDPGVTKWITHLREGFQNRNGCVSLALKDLLNYVCSKLLVWNNQRASIDELHHKLGDICSKKSKEIFNVAATRSLPRPKICTPSAKPITRRRVGIPDTKLPDKWDTINDNRFARQLFPFLNGDLVSQVLSSSPLEQPGLCDRCSNPTTGIFFDFSFTRVTEETESNGCKLCALLSKELGGGNKIVRRDSSLKLIENGSESTIFSIVVGPGLSSVPMHIQRGFPRLPEPGGALQTKLFQYWVADCVRNHPNCSNRSKLTETRTPTRLINIGDLESPYPPLKLACFPGDGVPDERQGKEYTILSHPWGNPSDNPPYTLTNKNLQELQSGIDFDKLPKNFQDAVKVTQSLGVQYLWIDSLCIIQHTCKDNVGDWLSECKNMGDYYSGAYCTIAATSTTGSSNGFLSQRFMNEDDPKGRRCHEFEHGVGSTSKNDSRFYLCTPIDDFAGDVEKSYLSTRGWVYQERALSRRTIHFAKRQAYFECGQGIRCETMAKLFNRETSFLSDPQFPRDAKEYKKGMRIEFYQSIFSRYSSLEFSWDSDRSQALKGVEKRLSIEYNVPVTLGVLGGSFLGRSLLWQRADGYLSAIEFKGDSGPGSWSWMGLKGPIQYLGPPFGGVTWELIEDNGPLKFKNDSKETEIQEFRAVVWGISQDVERRKLNFDQEKDKNIKTKDIGCVIVASDQEGQGWLKHNYVLLVTADKKEGSGIYRRIGVATLIGKNIKKNSKENKITLK